jgi:hypothetical protein
VTRYRPLSVCCCGAASPVDCVRVALSARVGAAHSCAAKIARLAKCTASRAEREKAECVVRSVAGG